MSHFVSTSDNRAESGKKINIHLRTMKLAMHLVILADEITGTVMRRKLQSDIKLSYDRLILTANCIKYNVSHYLTMV